MIEESCGSLIDSIKESCGSLIDPIYLLLLAPTRGLPIRDVVGSLTFLIGDSFGSLIVFIRGDSDP